jgi:glyoxylase-like metal-dependent hydrolase (beta-lactamase superfamily II)
MKTFEEIGEGIYYVMAKRSNVYLLAADGLTLVDTGMPGEERVVLDTIAALGRKPGDVGHILITHAHMDHIGALAALKKATGAQVVASRREADYIAGRKRTWTMGREGLGGKLFKAILFLMERFVFNYEPVEVDILCEGGEVIGCFGGIEVISTPGHSPGSLCYYQKEKKALVTGDLLNGMKGLTLPLKAGCSDYREALKAVEGLSQLEFEMCLVGHGEPVRQNARSLVKQLVQA